MPRELIVLIISMLPISELRGAIPIAVGVYEMSMLNAFCWAVLGNIIPIIFILWFLEKVSIFLIAFLFGYLKKLEKDILKNSKNLKNLL